MIADIAFTETVSEMLRTLREAVDELERLLRTGQDQAFAQVAGDMLESLEAIRQASLPYVQTHGIRLPDNCVCARDSLRRILDLYPRQPRAVIPMIYPLWSSLTTSWNTRPPVLQACWSIYRRGSAGS